MKIAILGATSQIAKNLIYYFIAENQFELFLFARDEIKVSHFIQTFKRNHVCSVYAFNRFFSHEYDAVINCVGIADPRKQRDAGIQILRVTEYYDNLILDYLMDHNNTTYINFSSGAVYGSAFESAVNVDSIATFSVNHIMPADYYRIAKLNAEVKHRSMSNHCIIDLRIFNFFSKYINLNSEYLICDILKCIIEPTVFNTNTVDIVRDFIAPCDLFELVKRCLVNKKINRSFDSFSASPIHKFDLLDFFTKNYGLIVNVDTKSRISETGNKAIYYSKDFSANQMLGYSPEFTSIDTICEEAKKLIIDFQQ